MASVFYFSLYFANATIINPLERLKSAALPEKYIGNYLSAFDENPVTFRRPIAKKCLKQRITICSQNTRLVILKSLFPITC